MANDWKKRLGLVYSTNPDFEFEKEWEEKEVTLPHQKQNLIVGLDKRNRKGKAVTLISGFKGDEDALKDLGKLLKTKCGVGGSAKDGEVLVQGDLRDKVLQILLQEGYRAKRGN
ncbi:MAG: translation initiation factor [Mangrovibacterium sp.]|nr:translation initiation factor [Mangrovibacterium sp.]